MFEPSKRERAFEPILRQIKGAIYSDKLKPGDKLPTERELAKIFNASRVSVRSAILQLEQSGFLEIKKGVGGGFYITELSSKAVTDSLSELLRLGKLSVAQISEAREIVEPPAASLAAERATEVDLEKLKIAISNFAQRVSENQPPDLADLNFHVCVAEISRNPAIIFVCRALIKVLFQTIQPYPLDAEEYTRIIAHHKGIYKAIRNGKREKAEELMKEHVQEMKQLFSEYEKAEKQST